MSYLETPETDVVPHDGEEAYLTENGKDLFKAWYEKCSIETMVHGEMIGEGNGRFFITRVLKDAKEWSQFDEDKHVKGAAIKWSFLTSRKRKRKAFVAQGTESKSPTPLQRRNKKMTPTKLKCVQRKLRLNEGKGFTYKVGRNLKGRKKGDVIKERPAKKIGSSCNDSCKKKCSEKLTEEDREEIFKTFWDTGDINLQRAFIVGKVTVQPKSRERKRKQVDGGKAVARRNRVNTRSYKLQKDNEIVETCQKFFLSTLGIDEKRVRTALDKSDGTGVVQPDQRGRHKNHYNVAEREEIVMRHIRMFKVVESHYVRKEVKYEYLPEDLTVSMMHNMYNEWCVENGHATENYNFYSRVFREKFNLKFQKPKKDVCDKCQTYKNIPIESRSDEMKEKQEKHIEEKDLTREFKSKMKSDGKQDQEMLVAAFDLEKVLLCPHGQTSSFYYCKRLKVHNFTVTDIVSMKTSCFIWHEGEAEKGSCEISTALQQYLRKAKSDGKKKIHLFADRCGGQNNNRMVIIALHEMFKKETFEELTLNFFVSGHSQNENDNAHSVIETTARKHTIYTLAQWETAIQFAFKKNPVEQSLLNHQDVINFQSKEAYPDYADLLTDKVHVNDVKLPKKESKVYWSKIMRIKFSGENREKMMFKYHYGDDEWKYTTICITPKTRSRKQNKTVKSK